MQRSWKDAELEISRLATASSHAFAEETLANANRLIVFATGLVPPPDDVSEGIWPTIRLSWSFAEPAPIEVEIHEHQYEFYQFFQGRTDIRNSRPWTTKFRMDWRGC